MNRLVVFGCILVFTMLFNTKSSESSGLRTKNGTHYCLTKCKFHDDGGDGYHWCKKGLSIQKREIRTKKVNRVKRSANKGLVDGPKGIIEGLISPSIPSAWDYCDPLHEVKEPHTQLSAKYKLWCLDECKKQEYLGYYTCNTLLGPDYCSPKNDTTYQEEKCTSSCDKHDYDYYWCKTSSSWNYCGYWNAPEEKKMMIEYTNDGNICADYCGKKGYSYDWCWYVELKEFGVPIKLSKPDIKDVIGLIVEASLTGTPLLTWGYCNDACSNNIFATWTAYSLALAVMILQPRI